MFATPKIHILALNRVLWHILRQNLSSGCSKLQEPEKRKKQKTNTFWSTKSRMRGNETPGRIVTNFCTRVWVQYVITYASFYDYRLRGLGVMGG